MGTIVIQTYGSFPTREKTFSAMTNGHADAVARAIEYLAAELLPEATARDHEISKEGAKPVEGFRRKG